MTDIAIPVAFKVCGREDCRIVRGPSSVTLLGWSQEYDKHGNPINKDPTRTVTEWNCRTCGMKHHEVSEK